MQYGQSIDNENAVGQIPRLLDIVLYLCERGHVEGVMAFQLLEDLTKMSTVKDCKEVFAYIERKQDILGKQELFGRGKLVMLRTCNQLLHRLSKEHFCNPASSTLSPSKWQKFVSSFTVVSDTFEAQPLSEDDGNANNLEQEEAAFSIKYLTSSKLMGLELRDPSFRRHILVQCLILFDYLKSPGKNDKDGPSESMKEEIRACEERVKKLLEITPPKGKEFLQSIEHILEREKNWVWWKREGCPAFEKQPIERKTLQDGARKRKPRWRLGNRELSQLWKWADQNPNALTDPQRVRTPSVTEYWKPLAEDMDDSSGIEAEYHHKNNRVYCWKGLRFSARQDLEGFSRFTDHGIEGVVPPELLPPEVRSKYHAKPSERNKRAKKEDEQKNMAAQQPEDSQAANTAVETDGGGNGGDLEDAAPESQKQSPEMELAQEPAQSEVETGEVEAKDDIEMKGEDEATTADDPEVESDPPSKM